ncbi:hypothetical protein [Saccharopolyspora phatthalungensis]|uniref:Uncharacterized protein n=1 Tax=Saccharopolyspora phatthalungensis TaxID=664693 RepID=A0A840QJD6_9PSEU|nr:hypothetical protein [Saccharopolyspora phatthalungensis]MBB5159258.1 hypothetical protein [Saccharopolyspora phatthalungensis]
MRVLEDAAFRQGFQPIRLFALLLPVHELEVRATTRTGRPYGLIDKFIERTIAEAGVATVPEIAGFLRLDQVLVDRAVRVLRGIGHLRAHSDALELTALARESLRDDTCYEIRREDRRKLYFDAYRCEPLHRRHYGESTALLNRAEALAENAADNRFQLLTSLHQFRREALENLAHRDDREEFNLPHTVENPQDVRPEYVFLRIYVVRAMARGGHIRHLAYGADTGGEFDEGLSDLCTGTPDIAMALQQSTSPVVDQERRINRWLTNQQLADRDPMRFPDGSWHVDLQTEDFEPIGTRKVSTVGSFIDLWSVVVRVWCEDADVRRRALLARTETWLLRLRYRPAEFPEMLRQLSAQLEFPDLDASRLRALVIEAGRDDLAEQIDRLAESGGTGT